METNVPLVQQAGPPSRDWSSSWRWLGVLLGVVSVVAFLPILDNGFVSWDDGQNFLENVGFRGLRWENLRWAWTTFVLGVYQPLAWMLLEAQYVASGMDPWGYHFASLLLHAANAIVLFVLTVALLDRVDRAAGSAPADRRKTIVAAALAVALFAVHPLRVEVVAWVSCQPYLPCAFFSMVSVLSYLRACDEQRPSRRGWLVLAWLLFLAALLSKAVAVTLPLVLLILDVYPLRRLGGGAGRWLGPDARAVWYEKLPFLALSLVFNGLAIVAKSHGRLLHSLARSGISTRIAQACYGTCFYLVKTVFPFGLSAYYPLPQDLSLTDPIPLASVLMVIVMSLGTWRFRRRVPGLLAAWICYLVILSPNLGFIRIGQQIAADRYCYIALLGGVIVLAGTMRWIGRRRGPWRTCIAAGLGLIVILSALSWRQCLTWRNSLTLWTHALEHGGRDDGMVNYGVAHGLFLAGRNDEARPTFERSLVLDPKLINSHITLGVLLSRTRNTEEAKKHFNAALALDPGSADAMTGLGILQAQEGRLDEAERSYRAALRINPDQVAAHMNLGLALARQRKYARAVAEFRTALRIHPNQPETENNLGSALADQGKNSEAIAHYAEALRLKPKYPDAHAGMGSALARLGRHAEATAHYSAALRLQPDHSVARNGLAHLQKVRDRPDAPR